ncbi:MAG: minor capsid protein [Oricola sp.]|nr:minor capsid protein [Oricola sp.]
MAVNDDLADDALLRSVRYMRATNATWQTLLPILRRAERDLIAKIEDGAPRTLASQRAERLLRSVREIIENGSVAFYKELEQTGKRLAEVEEAAALQSLQARVPVDVEWVRPSARLLEAVAVSKPFEGALLKDHLAKWSADTIFAMRAEIRTAIVVGEGIEPMQRRLRRVADIKIREARTIARTYTSHVTNEARAILYAENSDVILKEQWVATLDHRTCPICGALDGKTYELGKGPRAPIHHNCRCVRIPITRAAKALREKGLIGPRAAKDAESKGMTGKVPSDMTFPQWLKRQPESVQKEVLGASRYEMFKDGANFDKFVNDENEIIPLRDL